MSKALTLQKGNIVAFFVLGIAAAAVLATVAFTGYFQITRGASVAGLVAQSNALLSQAAYTLTTESSDIDGDGYLEAPAMNVTGTVPSGGGVIPASSGAPKSDSWGTAIGYCSWDNGTSNSSSGRITGDGSGVASQASVVFAVISAGPNHAFDTSCAQAKSGAAQGDDRLVRYTQAQLVQGVGGTVFFGDPVADATALNSLNTSSLKDGQLRLQKNTNQLMRWDGGSSSWSAVQAAAGAGGGGIAATSVPFKNILINGNFDVWQRGTVGSASSGAQFGADHWIINGSATTAGGTRTPYVGYNWQQLSLYNQGLPSDARYALTVNRPINQVGGSGDWEVLAQRIEDVRTLANSTVTASFYIKVNGMGAGQQLCADFAQYYGAGSNQATVTGIGRKCYTPSSTLWTLVTLTATLPPITAPLIGGAGNSLWFRPILDSIHGGGVSFSIARAQVEAGATATSFEIRPYSVELLLAQRYGEEGWSASTVLSGANTWVWSNTSFKVAKYPGTPALTLFGDGKTNNQCKDPGGSGQTNVTSVQNVSLGGYTGYRLAASSIACWFQDHYFVEAENRD